MQNATSVAPVNAGLRNSRRSSSGAGARSSKTTNSMSPAIAPVSEATITALPQPWSLPRISEKTSGRGRGRA